MSHARLSVIGQYGLLFGLVGAALFILWTELRAPPSVANAARRSIAITATSLPGAGSVIGPFRLISAQQLASPDKAFGGLSSLAVLPDGQLLAVTDAGDWLVMQPGAANGEMGSIAMPGTIKSDRDAEGLVLAPSGETLISFEQQHRILRFAGFGPPLSPVGEPLFRTATMGWPPNGGGESLAALDDGSLIWIAEQAPTVDGALTALLITPEGPTRSILIDPVEGFSPTDAIMLDETHMLMLHRRYTPTETAAAVTLVDLAPVLAGGGAAPATLLARWGRDDRWPVDNMEGLALVRRKGRPPQLYVVSDDNFSAAQRTLLLQLEIISPLVPAAAQ